MYFLFTFYIISKLEKKYDEKIMNHQYNNKKE